MKITTKNASLAKIKETKGIRHLWLTFPLAIPLSLIMTQQKWIDKGNIATAIP